MSCVVGKILNNVFLFQRYKHDHLLEFLEPLISKEKFFWKSISVGERLSVTLQFLSTPESQQSLLFSYCMGKSTVSNTIFKTGEAI